MDVCICFVFFLIIHYVIYLEKHVLKHFLNHLDVHLKVLDRNVWFSALI